MWSDLVPLMVRIDGLIMTLISNSSKRSIQHLLDKWSLSCRLIPKATFDFDDSKYIQDDESSSDDESTNSATSHIRIRSGALASVFLLEITALS